MTEKEFSKKTQSIVDILHGEVSLFPISWNKKKAIVNILKNKINKCKSLFSNLN